MSEFGEEYRRLCQAIDGHLPKDAIRAFEDAYWPTVDLPDNPMNAFVRNVAGWAFVAGWKAHRDQSAPVLDERSPVALYDAAFARAADAMEADSDLGLPEAILRVADSTQDALRLLSQFRDFMGLGTHRFAAYEAAVPRGRRIADLRRAASDAGR